MMIAQHIQCEKSEFFGRKRVSERMIYLASHNVYLPYSPYTLTQVVFIDSIYSEVSSILDMIPATFDTENMPLALCSVGAIKLKFLYEFTEFHGIPLQ